MSEYLQVSLSWLEMALNKTNRALQRFSPESTAYQQALILKNQLGEEIHRRKNPDA